MNELFHDPYTSLNVGDDFKGIDFHAQVPDAWLDATDDLAGVPPDAQLTPDSLYAHEAFAGLTLDPHHNRLTCVTTVDPFNALSDASLDAGAGAASATPAPGSQPASKPRFILVPGLACPVVRVSSSMPAISNRPVSTILDLTSGERNHLSVSGGVSSAPYGSVVGFTSDAASVADRRALRHLAKMLSVVGLAATLDNAFPLPYTGDPWSRRDQQLRALVGSPGEYINVVGIETWLGSRLADDAYRQVNSTWCSSAGNALAVHPLTVETLRQTLMAHPAVQQGEEIRSRVPLDFYEGCTPGFSEQRCAIMSAREVTHVRKEEEKREPMYTDSGLGLYDPVTSSLLPVVDHGEGRLVQLMSWAGQPAGEWSYLPPA